MGHHHHDMPARRHYTVYTLCTFALISLFSHRGVGGLGLFSLVPHFDKIAHFLVYALVGMTIGGSLMEWHKRRSLRVMVTLMIVAVLGAIDEWHQSFVPGRDPNHWDWLVDLVGGAVGAGIFVLLFKRNREDWAKALIQLGLGGLVFIYLGMGLSQAFPTPFERVDHRVAGWLAWLAWGCLWARWSSQSLPVVDVVRRLSVFFALGVFWIGLVALLWNLHPSLWGEGVVALLMYGLGLYGEHLYVKHHLVKKEVKKDPAYLRTEWQRPWLFGVPVVIHGFIVFFHRHQDWSVATLVCGEFLVGALWAKAASWEAWWIGDPARSRQWRWVLLVLGVVLVSLPFVRGLAHWSWAWASFVTGLIVYSVGLGLVQNQGGIKVVTPPAKPCEFEV